jgi:hypothetical protein
MANTKHADPFATTGERGSRFHASQPLLHQHGVEVQRFGEMRLLPTALSYEARAGSGQLLNHILADSIILYNLDKNGAEQVPALLSRRLEAHKIVIQKVRDAITKTAANRDDGTNDMLMGRVLRTNELQVWFVAEHLVDVPAVRL